MSLHNFSPNQIIQSQKVNQNFSNLANGTEIQDGVITNAKLATPFSYQYRRATVSGTTDTTGTSYINIINFNDIDIPTWATKAVVHWYGSCYTVTAVTDGAVRLRVGSGDYTAEERLGYNSFPINTVMFFSSVNEITLTNTGTQTFTLQCREMVGSGAIRFITSGVWRIKIEYYP